MHTPKPFRVEDLEDIHSHIDNVKLAQLVSVVDQELLATPLPLYLIRNEGEYGTLYGHIAKPNPQNSATQSSEALVIFQGPDQYITPTWYAQKEEDGKVVPTWDYLAIHAHGPLEIITDPSKNLEIVSKIVAQHEPKFSNWTEKDAPPNFIEAQLKGIVGVRIPVKKFEASAKLSQEKPSERANVLHGVDSVGNEEVGQLMREF